MHPHHPQHRLHLHPHPPLHQRPLPCPEQVHPRPPGQEPSRRSPPKPPSSPQPADRQCHRSSANLSNLAVSFQLLPCCTTSSCCPWLRVLTAPPLELVSAAWTRLAKIGREAFCTVAEATSVAHGCLGPVLLFGLGVLLACSCMAVP